MGKRGGEMFQLREAEKSEFLLSLCFVLCRPSKDYMMPIHIGEGNLRNPPTQVLILSRDIFTDTPRSNCLIWAICGQSS